MKITTYNAQVSAGASGLNIWRPEKMPSVAILAPFGDVYVAERIQDGTQVLLVVPSPEWLHDLIDYRIITKLSDVK